MNNKNIIEINENELKNVSGGVEGIIEDSIAEDRMAEDITAEYNRKKTILLRGGLMLGVLAVAYVGLTFLEVYIDPNVECMSVTDDIRCCCRCDFS